MLSPVRLSLKLRISATVRPREKLVTLLAHGHKLLFEHFVHLADKVRRDCFQVSDPIDHLELKGFRETGQHLAGLLMAQVHEDDGHGLGVLVADEIGQDLRIDILTCLNGTRFFSSSIFDMTSVALLSPRTAGRTDRMKCSPGT